MTERRSGFTLVEMSGVLVIIGLMAGGIVMARSFIHTSQLQAVIREYDTYVKATQEFRDKYQALPGDFKGATALWGAMSSDQCAGSSSPTPAMLITTNTCDGDGDDHVAEGSSSNFTNWQLEWYGAWKQLSNAKMIDGQYSGGTYNNGSYNTLSAGYNAPASYYPKGVWLFSYLLNPTDTDYLWGDNYGNVFVFTGNDTSGYGDPPTNDSVMPGIDVYTIDAKIDDGLPGTGIVRTWRTAMYYMGNCTIDGSRLTSQYNTARKTADCSILFVPGL